MVYLAGLVTVVVVYERWWFVGATLCLRLWVGLGFGCGDRFAGLLFRGLDVGLVMSFDICGWLSGFLGASVWGYGRSAVGFWFGCC